MVYLTPGMKFTSSSRGPNLPANGVTLSDTSERADQGHFTVIPLDSSQQWSYKWDTQRLKTQIDPGTYTIYVTTEPADLANLGGSSTYKTLEVYLQDTHAPQGESGPGTYTLNPEKHTSSPMPTIVMGTVNVTPSFFPATSSPTAEAPVETIAMKTPVLTSMPVTTQAGLLPGFTCLAIAVALCLFTLKRRPS